MPRSSPGGGWAQVELTDALLSLLVAREKYQAQQILYRQLLYCTVNFAINSISVSPVLIRLAAKKKKMKKTEYKDMRPCGSNITGQTI